MKIFVKVVKTGSRCYHKLYLQVPTHCLLLFASQAGDLLDSVKIYTQEVGAGLGTMAGTCGAISGAAVVAGLINQDKAGTSQTVRSVMNQFKQQNGTVICKDLKGVETGKVIRSCDDCVRDAVKFLEDALKSEN